MLDIGEVARRSLVEQADRIDETVRKLAATRDGLRHVAVCPAPGHGDCPRFQALLRAALAGPLGATERPRATAP